MSEVTHARKVTDNFGIIVRTTKVKGGFVARLRHPNLPGFVSLAALAPTRDAGCKTAIRYAKKNFNS